MNGALSKIWAETVARSPSAIAVVDTGLKKEWGRAELASAAAALADSFPRKSGKPALAGRRVAMAVPNGAEWFQVFLGLLGAGAIPVPIDPSEPGEATASAALSIGATHVWQNGALQPLRARGRAFRGECLVKLTSGSGGAPKALPVTDAEIEADGRQICASMGIGPSDSNLAAIPLGYSYGLGNLVAPLLLQGTRAICLSGALPHALASDALRYRPTVFPAVPPILKALVASDVPRGSLASLRLVISAGSPLSPETSRAFAEKFSLRVHGFYGTSETGGISFDRTGDATLEGRSVGSPLKGVRITAARAQRLRISSPAVLGGRGFSPADRAVVSAAGEIVLLGRTDRVVKVAGRRVDLSEIEAALRSVPGVRDAYAHMVGAQLSAAVATGLSGSEVRRLVRRLLASWKVPARIVAVREFPATPRGKTDAPALRHLLSIPRTAASISTLSAERHMSAPR